MSSLEVAPARSAALVRPDIHIPIPRNLVRETLNKVHCAPSAPKGSPRFYERDDVKCSSVRSGRWRRHLAPGTAQYRFCDAGA
jgi:hypothetical protein